jgi:hypothetical protein
MPKVFPGMKKQHPLVKARKRAKKKAKAVAKPAVEQVKKEIQVNQEEDSTKQLNQPVKKYTKKRLNQFKMLDSGCTALDTLKISNNKATISKQAAHQLIHEYKKYQLASPELIQLSHKVIKEALKGKEHTYTAQKVTPKGDVVDYKEVIAPTYANRLAAASMVYDRFDPVKQTGSGNGESQPHPINLQLYINVGAQIMPNNSSVKAIDIPPTNDIKQLVNKEG